MATKTTTTITEDDEYKKRVTNPYNEAAGEYKTVYDNRVAEIDKTIDAQKDAANAQAQKDLSNANTKYRRQYDANAIQEIVDQKALNERMANLGLNKSGLNATQQTAIALARGNRDVSTTASHNQFIDDTNLALQEMYNEAEAERASKKLAAQQQYADDLNATKLGYENAYNEYLNQQAELANEAQKTQNDFLLAQYKALLSAGKYDEAAALVGGDTDADGTTPTTADPKTIPYSQRMYKKVKDRTGFGDWWGGSEWFYDPIDDVTYSDDQLEEKFAQEGLTDWDIYKNGNDNNLEDIMDDLAEDGWFVVSDARNGTYSANETARNEYWLSYYDGNKAAQKQALMKYLGYDDAKANGFVEKWYK